MERVFCKRHTNSVSVLVMIAQFEKRQKTLDNFWL